MLNKAKRMGKDPLYRNSAYIMATSVVSSAFGFFFWILAAKLYPKEDVGLATALISSMSLLILLTRFGFDASLIRFLASGDRTKAYSSALTVTTFAAFLAGAIYVLGIGVFSPQLSFLSDPSYAGLYVLFLCASSTASITSSAFLALREGKYYLLQSLLMGSRLIFLLPLAAYGLLGLYSSYGIAYMLVALSLLLLIASKGIKPGIGADRAFLRKTWKYSAGNYLAGLLSGAPALILPLMILSILGAEQAAYYYIAYAIAGILYMIPSAVSTSLFVEGSHGAALKKTVLKSIKTIYAILIPATLVLYFGGGVLLSAIGKDYDAGALELMKAFALAGIFMAPASVYYAIKKIQKGVKDMTIMTAIQSILLLGLTYVLIQQYGLIGAGWGWVATYAIMAIIMAANAKREGWV